MSNMGNASSSALLKNRGNYCHFPFDWDFSNGKRLAKNYSKGAVTAGIRGATRTKSTCMPVFLIVGPKCTLAASYMYAAGESW